MPHERLSLKWFFRFSLLWFLLMGCEDRVAGTSTSVGTSIGGTALLADGGPAAGARVKARSAEIVFRNGQPESRVIDSAVADALGRFQLSVSVDGAYLEITCGSPAQVYFGDYSLRLNEGAALGTLRMAVPGAIRGTVMDSLWDGDADSLIWIGIRGTGNFVKLEKPRRPSVAGSAAFRLDGLFPGGYRLMVVHDSGRLPDMPKMSELIVKSGEVSDAGAIGL